MLGLLAGLLPLRFSGEGRFDAEHRSFDAMATWWPFVKLLVTFGEAGSRITMSIAGFKKDLRTPGADNPPRRQPSSTDKDSMGSSPAHDGDSRKDVGVVPPAELGRDAEHGAAPDSGTPKSSRSSENPSGVRSPDEPVVRQPGFIERVTQNRWFRLAWNVTLRRKVLRWLGRFLLMVLRSATVRTFDVRVRASFDDFEQTGRVAGYIGAAQHALRLGLRRPWVVKFEGVFDREGFEARAVIDVRTSLVRLAWPLMVALLAFPYLAAWRGWRSVASDSAR